MCDLNKVSNLLIAAKISYLAILVLLAIGMINSGGLFTAAANVPLMIAAIALGLASIATYILARVELDTCVLGGACGDKLVQLRSAVMGLIVMMGAFNLALAALALVASIPFAGAADIGVVIGVFIVFTVSVTSVIEVAFARAVEAFNNCRAGVGESTIRNEVIILSYVNAVAGAVFIVVGGLTGAIPWYIMIQG